LALRIVASEEISAPSRLADQVETALKREPDADQRTERRAP
jgi:hypothetical protein